MHHAFSIIMQIMIHDSPPVLAITLDLILENHIGQKDNKKNVNIQQASA